MRAYRHEKPARVGGLNRDSDGVMTREYMNAQYSDLASQPETGYQVPVDTPRAKKHGGAGLPYEPATPSPHHTRKKGALYGTPVSNASTDSHQPLRPNAASSGTRTSTPTRSRNASPRKSHTIPGSFDGESLDFASRYSQSEAGYSEDSRGTRSQYTMCQEYPGTEDVGRDTLGDGLLEATVRGDSVAEGVVDETA